MKRLLLLWVLFSGSLMAQSPILSDQAEISLITCGPGQNELYSAFGHSALRVKDPVNRIDLVFNYGTFDFDQPNFYLNFARGHLLYQLSVSHWSRFLHTYRREGRYVHEQVLNLDSLQVQAYFDFLIKNSQEENRNYYYDYFYDNCATRIKDALDASLPGGKLSFSGKAYYQPPKTIRQLCDEYLAYQPWGDLGIDICLGLPMDRKADQEVEMFLPDLLAEAFSEAQIIEGAKAKPLVREKRVLLEQHALHESPIWQPFLAFGALLVVVVTFSLFAYNQIRVIRFLDAMLYLISGALGIFLLALWLLTDHQAAAWNFNLLIFLPTNLGVVLALFKGRLKSWQKAYFQYQPYYYALLLAAWLFLPQELPLAFMPWVAVFILRSWHIARKYPAFKRPLR